MDVSVTADNPQAMRQALEAAGIDVAVLWSLCRETFSFAAYEAAAAGAAILTGPDSGNIAAFTRAGGHGLVLRDEATLFAQFESGAVRHLSRAARRPEICEITFSGMSVDLLEALS
jgi:D-tyrosyl-tRNA(Tyr) deacylase